MRLSSCGIDCDACKYKSERACKGCNEIDGKPFWGDCDLYACAKEKAHDHCGQCDDFACKKLEEWAASETLNAYRN